MNKFDLSVVIIIFLIGLIFILSFLLRRALNKIKKLKVEYAYRERESRYLNEENIKQQMAEEEHRSKIALTRAEEQYEKRLKEQQTSGISVVVHPFVNVKALTGLISKEQTVEVGYKYQLMVQGFPCFEPHTVIIETATQKELNQEAIDYFTSKAMDAADLAISAKTGGAAGAVIKIGKKIITKQ